MDNFVRTVKPLPTASRPPLHKTSSKQQPPDNLPPPTLQHWHSICSEAAKNVDVTTLSQADVEDILRLFDLNPTYGPFVGIDRMFRWQRAELWGLQPPTLIRDILEKRTHVAQREGGYLW